MKKRDGDIASLFQKIVAKKNSSSSSIPLNDAIDHYGNIGPSVRTTGDSRISGGGDIVPSVNLIIDSRTSEENVDSSGTPTPSRCHQCHHWFMIRIVFHKTPLKDCLL
jgi:hypothetical protein